MKKILKKWVRSFFDFGNARVENHLYLTGDKISQIEQRRLFLFYKNLVKSKSFLPSINDVGFRFFSQNDEDGILLYIFALIGMKSRLCVDIAFANPFGSNTANLICNFGWNGLLICGPGEEKNEADKFFAKHPDTLLCPPKIVRHWVAAENVNQILEENGTIGEIDLLSLDIDGVDYWIWDAIQVIKPRVVVVEFQNYWGHQRSVTVPYKSDFNRFDGHKDFYGASLSAFVKLAASKGYRLVGCNRYVFNAFFVKNGEGEELLPAVSAQSCFDSYFQPAWAESVSKARLNSVKNLDWMEV